jgi:hypothetical protein
MSLRSTQPLPDSGAATARDTGSIEISTDADAASSQSFRRVPQMSRFANNRAFGAVLTAAIVGLTGATAYIHLGLGGVLFTLNGLGYLGLAALILIGAAAPMEMVQRFSWFPRVALMGYAAMTIAAYLVMGPYFTLGWIAKGIEVAIIALVAVDIMRVYGSPMGLVKAAIDSVAPFLPDRFRPTPA